MNEIEYLNTILLKLKKNSEILKNNNISIYYFPSINICIENLIKFGTWKFRVLNTQALIENIIIIKGNSMNFKPLGERVLVKRTEVENKTASGIYIPDNAKEKPQTAEVVAVGNKVEDVKVGDTIVFEQYRGTEFKLDGQEYLILNIENVIGVM